MKRTNETKRPKTELDRKFLEYVELIMLDLDLDSDRAMSIELQRHPDFINRVRNGVQSAPPEAWDILLDKYKVKINFVWVAEERTNHITGNQGSIVTNTQGVTTTTTTLLPDSEIAAQNDLLKVEIASLRNQLRDKERIIQLLENQQKPSQP